jgi:hypothetical protein
MPELHELTRRLQGARWSVALLFGPGAGLAVGYLVHSSARALIPPGEQNYDDVISWDFGPATLAAIATTALVSGMLGQHREHRSWRLAALGVLALPLLALVVGLVLAMPRLLIVIGPAFAFFGWDRWSAHLARRDASFRT